MTNEERVMLAIVSTYLTTEDPKGMMKAAKAIKDSVNTLAFFKAVNEVMKSIQIAIDAKDKDETNEVEELKEDIKQIKEDIKKMKSQLNHLKATHTIFGG